MKVKTLKNKILIGAILSLCLQGLFMSNVGAFCYEHIDSPWRSYGFSNDIDKSFCEFHKEKTVKIVQLGDSYSAGNGADGYGHGPINCERNSNNWGVQFVEALRKKGVAVDYINGACSGAKINAVSNSQENYSVTDGEYVMSLNINREISRNEAEQELRKQVKYYNVKNSDYDISFEYISHRLVTHRMTGFLFFSWREKLNVEDRYNLVTYKRVNKIKPQLEHVDDTDAVIMTLGGNDLGFEPIVKKCLIGFFYNKNECYKSIINAEETIKPSQASENNDILFKDYLKNTLETILQKMKPDGKLILVGYPYIVEPYGSSNLASIIFTQKKVNFVDSSAKTETKTIREISEIGNSVQQSVINELSVKYPGRVQFISQVLNHFDGHAPGGRWSYNPDSWLHDSIVLTGLRESSMFHPNPRGQQEYAKVVEQNQTLITPKSIGVDSMPVDILFVIDESGNSETTKAVVRSAIWRIRDGYSGGKSRKRIGLVATNSQESRVIINMTTDYDKVLSSLNSLQFNTFSTNHTSSWNWLNQGVKSVLNQDFRNGVRKMAFVVSTRNNNLNQWSSQDEYQKFKAEALKKAYELDPVEFYVIGEQRKVGIDLAEFASGSGGQIITFRENPCDPDDKNCQEWHGQEIGWETEYLLDTAMYRPFVILDGGKIMAQIGQPVKLNAGGSYSVNDPIKQYEWDFDGDRKYDQTTVEPFIEHTYTQKFRGYVGVKATDTMGRSNISSIELIVERDLDDIADEYDNCPDVTNHEQTDYNDDGIGDACDPERPTELEELEKWWLNAQMIHAYKKEISELMASGETEEKATLIYLERLKDRFPGDVDEINRRIVEFKKEYGILIEPEKPSQISVGAVVEKSPQIPALPRSSSFNMAQTNLLVNQSAAINQNPLISTKNPNIESILKKQNETVTDSKSEEKQDESLKLDWKIIAGAITLVIVTFGALIGLRKNL